jgi:YaaC-like Protein
VIGNSPVLTESLLAEEAETIYAELRPLLDIPFYLTDDCVLCPSIWNSDFVPMPASLARYLLMYYVSMLARYAPERLDMRTAAKHAWLLDAFVDQSALRLLHSFLNGISGKTELFSPAT